MKKTLPLIMALVFSVVLAGCSQAQPESETTPAADEAMMEGEARDGDEAMMDGEESADGEAMEGEAMMDGEVTKMTLDSFGFGYSEETITAAPGETIELTLTNSQGMHDWVIDEIEGAKTEVIEQGETDTITFTIPEDAEPGTEYEYYCSVGNHREQGMVGTLIVE